MARAPASKSTSGQGDSALAKHLAFLAQRPNKFQGHAQASLRVLERRRSRAALLASTSSPGADDNDAASGVFEHAEACAAGACRKNSMDSTAEGLSSKSGSVVSIEDFQANAGGLPMGPELKTIKEAHSNPVLSTTKKPDFLSQSFHGKNSEAWPAEVLTLLASVPKGCHAEPVPEPAESGLRLQAGVAQIPHPRKAKQGGEDSYFVCSQGTACGVADGVGEWGWRFKINPRAFADELMTGARLAARNTVVGTGTLPASSRAALMLSAGYGTVTCFGSATALVVGVDATGRELGVANLGDSGMRQFRFQHGARTGGTVATIVRRTKEQQHMFNCPYQLTRLPQADDFPKLLSEGKSALVNAVKGMRPSHQDIPEDADLYGCPLKEGDLIVLGTDGLFDNVHDDELCQLLGSVVSPLEAGFCLPADGADAVGAGGGAPRGGSLDAIGENGHDFTESSVIASALAMAAFHKSKDRSARTPFSLHAKEAGLYHVGGKMDDITVIAAWVVRTSASS